MSLTYRCQLQNRWITLTQELANSGEAKVWHTNFNGYLAKIYHNPHNERVDKLQLMVRNRPGDPNSHLNHISFAWPYSILEDNQGKVAGFLMPEVVGSETLLKLCTPKLRRQDKLEANWYFLHVVARNIAAIIQAIHAKGYVLGDIKLENILVNNRALPTIIDTDSFQVSDPDSSKIYRCLVGSEGFTPAELIGVNIADVDQTEVHDRFRLGVVIYYLLFSGPPFRGLWQGAGDSLEQSELIRRGLWPFSGDKLVVPSNTTIPLNILHRDLHALFLRCFNEGHKFPDRRPTAEEWRGTLEAALKEVIRCSKIDNHYYNRSYGKCYWCERFSDLNFDIFPGKSIATVTPTPSPKVAPPAPSSPPPPPAKLTPFTENLPNGLTLEMVGLPAGQFLMGSPDSDPDARDSEKPQHQVKVNSFAIGKYPVTQAQYQAVMGTNHSQFKNNPQNPVESVSWNDAQAFCQKLSQITGKTYRLPTEAEWEYACRAGTTTRYYFGDDANQLGDYAWYDGNSQSTTHPVGQKKPNVWGLYDMSGNVWEWCQDNWHYSYINAPSDGSAWLTYNNDYHILRGGSWRNLPDICRSAYRGRILPDNDRIDFGFRVACVPNVTSTQLPIATVTSTPLPKVAPPAPSSPPPPPAKLAPFTEKISKGITLEMVGLPAGQFLMGSPDSDPDAESFEKPQHQVKINSFAIGKYPITQAQYQAVMGINPSYFKINPQNPVEGVSWDDAQAFCKKLSQITGKTYRLPTEAEWEYACRAGTTTRYYFGDDANQLGDYAWYSGNSQQTTHPVGQKRPNAWGLYDMSGNVREWCEDNWHGNYIGAPKDGSAWLTNDSDYSIVRGGSWYTYPPSCRSAIRNGNDRRGFNNFELGFRVVCVPNVTSTQLPIATVTSTPLPKVAPPAPSSPPPPPAKLTPFTEKISKGITLEMVGLPAGKFLMGSPDSDPDAKSYEKPQHQVKINSFAIGKYPVTQAQYQAVMGTNPSHFSNNPQNPVEKVSWDDAQAFCQKLSQITGKTYRLPTEAEWEYACRAGTTTRFYFGDDANQLGDYAWYDGNSQDKTHPVGQKRPNAWGLYDMSGSVWEWCEDNSHNNYIGAPKDGSAWLTNDNDYHILRGGSWYDFPNYCRSAYDFTYFRRDYYYYVGFRVVCVPNVTSTQLPIATVTSTPLPKVAPPAPSSPPPPPAKLTPFTEKISKGITLEMVGLPAGQFLMGSPDSDRDAESWEKPQHQVKINSFAIGKYPVTQAQYQAVMGTNPSKFPNNPQNPVERISWDDAQAFCQKLSQITGKTYRLPTEAEWEYACRGGTTTRFYFGDDANQLEDYAWYEGNSQNTTHPVGQKKPNAWGLYDMSGNVWEWCEDNWHNSYQNAPRDGSAWVTNNSNVHIIRGGSWDDIPEYCRSTDRSNGDILNLSIGFRVVCVPNVTSTQLPIATVTSTPLPKVVPTPLTNFTENLPKGITLEMVGLPAGQFLMGSPDSDPDATSYEKPQHPVKINSFAIGKYPVTQAQYQAVMGTNPSHFKNNPQNPVEMVSWHDAQAFCQKLSQITGKTYRLPTEAEWEYACRAGTTTRYYFGDDANQLEDYAWYSGNSQNTTHPVGQKKPNAWGLYDMSGNVWEWCEDNWHNSYAWVTNNSNVHIIRGGSWCSYPSGCRSAFRGFNSQGRSSRGFRVVCVPTVTSTQLPIATVTSTPLPKVVPTPLTNFTENLPKGITLEMVSLPAGQFLMGSPDSDRDARDFEKPQHQVKINSFAIGKYPVTQAQYQAVMGTNPSHFSNNPQNPVERISSDDAQAFCQKLSQITGKTYRLPTEAEWEYACRAGTTTRYYFGDDANQLGDYAWYSGNSQQTTHPVGQKSPNAFGLYDMHGNVWEWCEDNWHNSYQNAPSDGSAWLIKDNDYQIVRGGSWYGLPNLCRSAYRNFNYRRGNIVNYFGFRVVCVPNVTSTQLPIATVTSTPLPKVVPTPLTNFTENLPKGITLEMVGLPAGQFLMGSPDSDRDARDFEKPQHPVKINSFAIGKYPVTQAQYEAVMGYNPSLFQNNPQNPVESSSDNAQAFCQKLSQITGKTYRLPTEAEWEYACRAGTTTRFYFGDDANQLGDYAWYEGNSGGTTHPVGQKKPNAFGLCDMHGNVWEWCEDNWHDSYKSAPSDGSAWLIKDNDYQIVRGGSWSDNPNLCRSAFRFNLYYRRGYIYYNCGFRVVCVPP